MTSFQRNLFLSFTIAIAADTLSVCAFAPRFWQMGVYPLGNNYEWYRALTFLLQVEDPFRFDIEAAMRWRFLPPLMAWALHLPGNTPLVIPWIGAFCASAYVARLGFSRTADWRFALGLTVLFASTSAVIVPIGWFGMNDAWIWLALLVIAFSHSTTAITASYLLAPWVDVRFYIGLPIAWCARAADGSFAVRDLAYGALLLPYIGVRVALSGGPFADPIERHFLGTQLSDVRTYVSAVPMGWWMGLRMAWIPLVYGLWRMDKKLRTTTLLTLTVVLTVTVITAHDLSRSVAIVIPLVVAGALVFQREYSSLAPKTALWIAMAALLVPGAHVVRDHVTIINNIGIELHRWHLFLTSQARGTEFVR